MPTFLQVEDAHYSFGARAVLRGANIDAVRGEIVALVGANGAGKSTLISAITGRIALADGRVRIDGRDPRRDPIARRSMGFVPQQIGLHARLTVAESLSLFGRLMGLHRRDLKGRVGETLDRIGMSARSRDLVETLSGGMQRLVSVGAALVHDPTLLVLDEPTSGLDATARARLFGLLHDARSRGTAVLLTTHDLEDAEALADRVVVIVGGRTPLQGPPDQLLSQAFGTRREVTVAIDPQADDARSPQLSRLLGSLGLIEADIGSVWHGLVEAPSGTLPPALSQILVRMPGVQEVRISRPGLHALIERCAAHEDGR